MPFFNLVFALQVIYIGDSKTDYRLVYIKFIDIDIDPQYRGTPQHGTAEE